MEMNAVVELIWNYAREVIAKLRKNSKDYHT